LVALIVTLNLENNRDTKDLLQAPPPPEGIQNPKPEIRLGYAQGWALMDNWPRAENLALAPGAPADQWSTLVAVAAIALEKQKPDVARKLLETALDILDKDPRAKAADPWLQLRLARLGYQAGLNERLQPLVSALPDVSYQNRARLEKLRVNLANRPQAAAQELTDEALETKYPLELELLARHNARYGNSKAVLGAVAEWDETSQAFGYAGVMLGLQDSGK
jgi:hypothetical protein